MIKPTQTVIFCGGLGTRLRPITDDLPKPMVPVLDKPFLEYLLEQLAAQGIERFLLLTGYMGEVIYDYFGDGSFWGWEIEYSVGPIEWDTGRRLWEAQDNLDTRFLLLYADNFAQFNLNKLMHLHQKEQASVTLSLAAKENGNIRISSNGRIEEYSKNRIGDELNLVEIGYMVTERDAILSLYENIPNTPNISFSSILEMSVEKQQISGLVVNGDYHSISDKERLELMRKYLTPKKIILIDRDGIINVKAPRGEYIENWKGFKLIDDTVESMKKLALDGFCFIVITNQAGVSRGMVSEENLMQIHRLMIDKLKNEGIPILDIYVCRHHWDDDCECRKPRAGLFYQIAREHFLRMDKTLYIGDDVRDCEAAYNAECGSVLVANSEEYELIKNKPKWNINVDKLSDAVSEIKSFMEFQGT
ncbi:HAD-IIIA family hydrolase [Alphaproteobacteria bacterium]|nr:HAD-IIIA family hydrolase [Alphaproteobacteria bacterium]